MFGSHLSIAGGLHNALVEAKSLDMDCVQIFTKNQRQWAAPPLTDEAVKLWRDHRRSTGIDIVVSHDSYLINLASPKDDVREKSIALFRDELERCETLDIPFLVTHPGAHLGIGEDAGLRRVAEALDEIHQSLPGYRTITCLEITAGQGTTLGWRLEHLRDIINAVKQPERLAVCIDTAHAFAAGYDPASKDFLDELDATVGRDRVKVLHVNDSKVERGKRVDRHAHIGRGHIPLETFRVICNAFRGRGVPKILETPKEQTPEGIPWDTINLRTLRKLMR
jgi:deoxyribonuclease-4